LGFTPALLSERSNHQQKIEKAKQEFPQTEVTNNFLTKNKIWMKEEKNPLFHGYTYFFE
jgi:hypothetical protein